VGNKFFQTFKNFDKIKGLIVISQGDKQINKIINP